MATLARSLWVPRDEMEHILAALMPENAEALRVSMDYGARIGDVLSMRTDAARSGRWNYREQKTGKRRRVILSDAHRRTLLSFAGRVYCFEHRTDWTRHRTRQAVYKDICRAATAFRWLGTVSPHSLRKVYSVEKYKGDKCISYPPPPKQAALTPAQRAHGKPRGARPLEPAERSDARRSAGCPARGVEATRGPGNVCSD